MKEKHTPGIAVVLVIIGILSILGGLIFCVKLWPGDPSTGYAWKFIAYISALTWLFSGIISGVLFFAGSLVIIYLYDIREYLKDTKHIAKSLQDHLKSLLESGDTEDSR